MDSPKDQYEALRAVDPGAVVERPGAGPQARDLAVPPFVGGERYAPEGDAYGDREADRGRGAREWGPPRPSLDLRTGLLALGALAVSLSVGIAVSGLDIKPHSYLLVLLAPAIVMRRTRRYLLDFVPFAALILLYAQCRGFAHNLRPDPFYAPQLDAEKFLFGGAVPSVELQEWLWNGTKQWYDHVAYVVTRLHFIVPPLLAFALWVRRRALFYRFGATMVALSYAGALTFLLFPAAPPWAAGEKGLLDVQKLPVDDVAPSATAGGLVDPNPYAAVPSLHAGYAFLCFLFVATVAWRTRWRWWAISLGALYPLAECAAVVYTGNHYVVDLLLGLAYAAGALAAVTWFWRRRGWPE